MISSLNHRASQNGKFNLINCSLRFKYNLINKFQTKRTIVLWCILHTNLTVLLFKYIQILFYSSWNGFNKGNPLKGSTDNISILTINQYKSNINHLKGGNVSIFLLHIIEFKEERVALLPQHFLGGRGEGEGTSEVP